MGKSIVLYLFLLVPQIYSFPMFTKDICEMLMEEFEYYNQTDLPKGRPNSMNNYGVSLKTFYFSLNDV